MNHQFPEKIRSLTDGLLYREDTVGMSDSRVLLFDDMVLKIEKQSLMTEQQITMLRWLQGRVPVPEVICSETDGGLSYLLMTKIGGQMSCSPECMKKPQETAEAIAEGLTLLWAADISGCPVENPISRMLREAREYIEHAECTGWQNTKRRFDTPEQQLVWLEANKPEEDTVLSHGDFCMPNIHISGRKCIGFIDLAQSAAADRWYDIATMQQSMERNFSGFFGGPSYSGYREDMLCSALGIRENKEKTEYYRMLDELFSI